MIKVKELVSVHEYPEPLVLAVNLDLQGGKTEGKIKRDEIKRPKSEIMQAEIKGEKHL